MKMERSRRRRMCTVVVIDLEVISKSMSQLQSHLLACKRVS